MKWIVGALLALAMAQPKLAYDPEQECPKGTKARTITLTNPGQPDEDKTQVQCKNSSGEVVKKYTITNNGELETLFERPPSKSLAYTTYKEFYDHLSVVAKKKVPDPDNVTTGVEISFSEVPNVLRVVTNKTSPGPITSPSQLDIAKLILTLEEPKGNSKKATIVANCGTGVGAGKLQPLETVHADNGLAIERIEEGFEEGERLVDCPNEPRYRFVETCTDPLTESTAQAEVIGNEDLTFTVTLKVNDVTLVKQVLPYDDYVSHTSPYKYIEKYRPTLVPTDQSKAIAVAFDCHDYADWRLKSPETREPPTGRNMYDPDGIIIDLRATKKMKLGVQEDPNTRLKKIKSDVKKAPAPAKKGKPTK